MAMATLLPAGGASIPPQLLAQPKRLRKTRLVFCSSCGRESRGSAIQTLAAVAMAGSILLSGAPASVAENQTPYSQSQEPVEVGLVDGKIRSCPLDINPNCVSTASKYGASAALPWIVPRKRDNVSPIEELKQAIMSTEKNPSFLEEEHLENGDYIQAEVDGVFGRDVLEFLVKGDIVTYRSIAKKVVYIYPLTTPLTDFGAQQKRLKSLEDQLGWTPPGFEGFPAANTPPYPDLEED